jgi:hypothetical protein
MNREMAEIIRNRKPLTLPATATVQEACRHMHNSQSGAVLVTKASANWWAFSPGVMRCASWPRGRGAQHRFVR